MEVVQHRVWHPNGLLLAPPQAIRPSGKLYFDKVTVKGDFDLRFTVDEG
jgi:hypothetical protein